MKEIVRGATPWAQRNGAMVTTLELHGDGTITAATYQDVTKQLERNRNLRNDPDFTGNFQEESWGRMVADVPNTVLAKWIHEYGVDYMNPDHGQRILQLLDDPEFAFCKVVDERVARKPMRTFMKASTATPKVVAATRMPGA